MNRCRVQGIDAEYVSDGEQQCEYFSGWLGVDSFRCLVVERVGRVSGLSSLAELTGGIRLELVNGHQRTLYGAGSKYYQGSSNIARTTRVRACE